MNASRCLLTVTLGLLIVAGGCARKKSALDPEDADSPMPVSRFHDGEPLSLEECQRFADRLEAAAKRNRPEDFSTLFDVDALMERTLVGIGLSKRDYDSARKGVREASMKGGFTGKINEAVASGGSYRLLRVHDKGGEKRVLFRLAPLGAGMTYHDLILARRLGNQVRAIDVYNLMTGELLTTSMRRPSLAMYNQTDRGRLARLPVADQDLIKHMATWTKMAAAGREGNHQEALQLFNTLPPTLHKEKWIQILRLQSAAALSGELYQQAMDDYEKHFPNDPSLDLISIASFVRRKRYDEALAAVDRLAKAVGGDPFLDTVRAGILLESGKPEQARQAVGRALEALPDLEQPYWAMVSISLKEKDHTATAKWLTELDERFDLEFEDLSKVPGYADFIKSPEYKKWSAAREKDK